MRVYDLILFAFAIIVIAFTLIINDIGEVSHLSGAAQPSFFSTAVETIRKEAAYDPVLFR